jgi:hypothetical protein
MSPRTASTLLIDIETRPFERIEADVAVAGLFADDRPLRGAVARADWRLCGLLSQLVREGRITGSDGQCVLVPTDGRLRAPRLFVMGLGARTGRSTAAVQDGVARTLARVGELGLAHVALSPLGFPGDDWPRHAQAVVGGALEAARAVGRPLELTLGVPGASEARTRASLTASIDALGLPDVALARPEHRRAEDQLTRPRRSPQGNPPIHRHA